MKHLTRRVFLGDLARIAGSMSGLGLLAGCAPPPAAPPSRAYRVGMLTGTSAGNQTDEPDRPFFWQRLGELGYVERQNLAREIRQRVDEDPAVFDVWAADLVRLQVDVIVAGTAPGIRAAVAAKSSIPIVILGATIDPVALGAADSLARPGRNLTGTMGEPPEVEQKRLQLLVEAAPGVSKVAVLAAGPPVPDDFWESAARSLRVDLLTLRPTSLEELDAAFDRVIAEGADALLVQSGQATNLNADLIRSFAERHRLPVVYPSRPWITRGGLMTYQADGREIQRRTADYVDRILRGARPADLPIENPTRYALVVNMKAAQAIGLTFPPSFLAQVDEVIE